MVSHHQDTSSDRRIVRSGGKFADRPLRVLLAAFASLGICAYGFDPGCAATTGGDSNLSKLELKFFQHEYPKDTNQSRLERLEKMVFGETKTGIESERLANLLQAVPNLESEPDTAPAQPTAPEARSTGGRPARNDAPPAVQDRSAQVPEDEGPPPDSSKYPAVTAIENKLLGKDYGTEPINRRLDRLETKVFGKPTGLEDLSERVDRIKQATGIDIAKQPPAGSDWMDEEDDIPGPPDASRRSSTGGDGGYSSSGEDGKTFSGRDLRQDFQQAFPSRTPSYSTSGSYGMDPPARTRRLQQAAPPVGSYSDGGSYTPPPAPSQANPSALGLNQEVAALEQEIFGKSYGRDPLPARLSRLEATVFPNDKSAGEKPLPERVQRLAGVIPLSQASTGRIAQRSKGKKDDLDDLDDMDMGQPTQSPQPRASGGLSRLLNSMSNFFTGSFTGGYPMGALTPDPSTGLLYDRLSGNLVDPTTGVVVGQRGMGNMGMGGMGMGMGGGIPISPGIGMGSFGSGFSPYNSPYGYNSGLRFGMGGMGGMGGIGRMGGMGLWP